MVVTLRPATLDISVWQERTGWPSKWTVQAPHSGMPQPNLVPVMPSVSRRAQSRGIRGLTQILISLPLRVNMVSPIAILLSGIGRTDRKRISYRRSRGNPPLDFEVGFCDKGGRGA